MAPKRKRAADDTTTAAATRPTRTSTRLKEAGSAGSTQKGAAAASSEAVAVAGQDPAPKKARKTAAKTTKGTKGTSSKTVTTKAPAVQADANLSQSTPDDLVLGPPKPNASSGSLGSSAKAKATKTAATVQASASEPYSAANASALFSAYAEESDPSVIGPEGFEQLCNDAQIPLEGALPLVLAWQLESEEMGKISKEEWDKGTSELQISCLPALATALRDLEDLLITDKPPLTPPTNTAAKKNTTPEPYNRTRYYTYAANKTEKFKDLYKFCFALAKPPGSRNIDMETALAFWSVLVLPRYTIMQDIQDFINEKGTYKGVNKDLWLMVLDFCGTISPSLDNYEADGAWPTMLDEFVAWKKSKGSSSA